MKKGQGAIEYLMTYGWALLVIVVVGAALYAAGVLNPASYVSSKCTGFQYFLWQNQKLNTTQYVLEVTNGKEDIYINNVQIDSADQGTLTLSSANPQSPGRKVTITGANDPTTKAAGDTFTVTVTVVYNTTTIAGIRDSATCTGKVQ